MNRQRRTARRPVVEPLDVRRLLSGLSPSQLTHAYGLDAITLQAGGQTIKGDGRGQTIAIVDAYHDAYLKSDLNTFDRAYGLPAASVSQVNLAGSQADSGWAGEETLDTEWAHAIAPGASIVVVEARSDSFQDLIAAVRVAEQVKGVSAVSMSWGGSESPGQASYDSVFTTPAGHTGITFVAASGDEGTRGGAEWPSSSPNVLAVGGTTLSISSNGSYRAESVWSGSSGGNSRYEREPAYQRSVQSTGARSTPDVSFDGDPNTGVSVYTTDPSTGRGTWAQYGGTSLGAPAWAAIVAIADEGRALAGKGTLDGATQTMSALYSLPSSDFHTVSGSGARLGARFGSLASAGRGSPNGAALVSGLVKYGSSSASVTRTAVLKSAVAVATTARSAGAGQAATAAKGTSGPGSSGMFSRVGSSVAISPTSVVTSTGTVRRRHLFDLALQELATDFLRTS